MNSLVLLFYWKTWTLGIKVDAGSVCFIKTFFVVPNKLKHLKINKTHEEWNSIKSIADDKNFHFLSFFIGKIVWRTCSESETAFYAPMKHIFEFSTMQIFNIMCVGKCAEILFDYCFKNVLKKEDCSGEHFDDDSTDNSLNKHQLETCTSSTFNYCLLPHDKLIWIENLMTSSTT